MPFIHIKSLPMDESRNIQKVITGIARDFSHNTGILLEHIHTTWEFYQPGFYAKGSKLSNVQPESRFPIIVDLLTPDFNTKETMECMLESVAESISTRADFPKNNIFIHHRVAHSGMVYDDGKIVQW